MNNIPIYDKSSDNKINSIPVVTGFGVVAPNGMNADELFTNSINGVSGISSATEQNSFPFDTSKLRTGFFGIINKPELENTKDNRLRSMSVCAFIEALQMAGLEENLSEYGERCSLVTASLNFEDEFQVENDYNYFIKNKYNIYGCSYNVSSACASGTTAIGIAADLINNGLSDIVFVCGADSLSKTTAYGFNSLRLLSNGECHPLDENRDGINIGEGAGVIVLESEEHALKRNATVYSYILGHSDRNEAFHITSPDTSGNGFFSSMKAAIADAGITPEDIDYINLHGTGTPINDRTEVNAIARLYSGSVSDESTERHAYSEAVNSTPESDSSDNNTVSNKNSKPYISSLKTLIGHCMGAAGAIEAIMTIMCVYYGKYLPIAKVDTPQSELKDFPMTPPEHAPEIAMSNSFGFAGNTASIIFSKHKKADMSGRKMNYSTKNIYINGTGIISSVKAISSDDLQGISPRKLIGVTPFTKSILASVLLAKNDENHSDETLESERTGTCFSSAKGAVRERTHFSETVSANEPDECSPAEFANTSNNSPLGHICINFKCKGTSFCLHGADPFTLSCLQLKMGKCDTIITCTAEENAESESDNNTEASTIILSNAKTSESYCSVEYFESFDFRYVNDLLKDHVNKQETSPDKSVHDHETLNGADVINFITDKIDKCSEIICDEKSFEMFSPLFSNLKDVAVNKCESLFSGIISAAETLKSAADHSSERNTKRIFVSSTDVTGNLNMVILRKY